MNRVEQIAEALVAGKAVVVGNCTVVHTIYPDSAELVSEVVLYNTSVVAVCWAAGNLKKVSIFMGDYPNATTRKYINACLKALECSPGHPNAGIKCKLGQVRQISGQQWWEQDTHMVMLTPNKTFLIFDRGVPFESAQNIYNF